MPGKRPSFVGIGLDRRFGERSMACLWGSEEAERFEAPCDKAGHLCCRVVGRGAIPLPRFKGKTTPLRASYRRHRIGKARARIPLPIKHRNLRPSTMFLLRFSFYHLDFKS